MEETTTENPPERLRSSILTSEVHALTNLPESKDEKPFVDLDDALKSNMNQRYPTPKAIGGASRAWAYWKDYKSKSHSQHAQPRAVPFNPMARENLKGRLYVIPVLERTTEVDSRRR